MSDDLERYTDPDAVPQTDPDGPFVEFAPYESGFAAYFEKTLRPLVAGLAAARVAALAEYRRRKPRAIALMAVIIVGGVALTGAVAKWGDDPTFAVIVTVVGAFGVWSWMRQPIADFDEKEENDLLPAALRFFGDFTWRETGGMGAGQVDRTMIVPAPDPSSSNFKVKDQVTGTYKGLKIEFARVETAQGSGKSRSVLFEGDLIMVELARPFKAATIVRSDMGGMTTGAFGLQRVSLEDPAFAKSYGAFSNDQVEARVMLTPDVMERMVALLSEPDTSSLRFSFVEQTLCIAFRTGRRLFAPSVEDGSPSYAMDDLHRFLSRMHHALSMIDAVVGSDHKV